MLKKCAIYSINGLLPEQKTLITLIEVADHTGRDVLSLHALASEGYFGRKYTRNGVTHYETHTINKAIKYGMTAHQLKEARAGAVALITENDTIALIDNRG